MDFFYCKNCKHNVKPIDYWYLYDNTDFRDRIAIIGKCPKCKQDVIKLIETRKSDYKVFKQLEVGKKAERIGSLVIHQIDYTYSDSKLPSNQVPYGWKYGKAIKMLKEKCWKILRADWFGNTETIGYIPFNDSKIINVAEYEQLKN